MSLHFLKRKGNYGKTAVLKKPLPFFVACRNSATLKHSFVTISELEKEGKVKAKAKASIRNQKLWNLLALLLNVGIISIIFLTQYGNGDNVPFSSLFLQPIKWGWIAAAACLPVVFIVSRTLKTALLIQKSTHKFDFKFSYKTTAITKYYNDITPFATGGQPVQIFYLYKNGVDKDVAASVPLVNYIFWQLAYTILCLIVILSNTAFFAQNLVTTSIIWFSFVLNLVILVGIFTISISKRIVPVFVINMLKFLTKIKWIKNYNRAFHKSMNVIIRCQRTVRYFASNYKIIIPQILSAFIEIISINMVPYFIYLAFIPNPTLPAFEIITGAILCQLVIGVTPTPGGTGGAEFTFIALFGSAFETFGIIWPVLFWRFFTYYIFLLQGIVLMTIDYIVGQIKRRRLKKSELKNPTQII